MQSIGSACAIEDTVEIIIELCVTCVLSCVMLLFNIKIQSTSTDVYSRETACSVIWCFHDGASDNILYNISITVLLKSCIQASTQHASVMLEV